MGYRNGRRFRKFYWEQVALIKSLLARLINEQDSSVNVETYLTLCEQLGQEPDPEKMPLDTSIFPYEVQVAFFVLDLLPDRWEGMSGTYMGKDWSSAEFIFKIYSVENIPTVVFFAKVYESLLVNHRAEKAEKKRKSEQRRNKSKR